MPAVFTYRMTVPAGDIDVLGHANNAAYLRWTQSAAVEHSAVQGWSMAEYQRLGAFWIVRSHTIDYLQPTEPDDQIAIQTWVMDLKRISSRRAYRIERAQTGDLLAVAETMWVLVDSETGRPKRVPPALVNAFDLVPRGPRDPLKGGSS